MLILQAAILKVLLLHLLEKPAYFLLGLISLLLEFSFRFFLRSAELGACFDLCRPIYLLMDAVVLTELLRFLRIAVR